MSDADGGGVGLGGALGISAQPCDGPSGGDGDAGLDAAFAQLRQIVPLFAAMANPPNRAKMQTALQMESVRGARAGRSGAGRSGDQRVSRNNRRSTPARFY